MESLERQRLRAKRAGSAGIVPGDDLDFPIHPTTLRERIGKAWLKAGLQPLGFHEARRTAASLFIAAGLNAKTVSTYLGHSSISITLDRYGHLFPGSEIEARELLNAYLALSRTQGRTHGGRNPCIQRRTCHASKLAGPGNPRLDVSIPSPRRCWTYGVSGSAAGF